MELHCIEDVQWCTEQYESYLYSVHMYTVLKKKYISTQIVKYKYILDMSMHFSQLKSMKNQITAAQDGLR
jgi:hypothetical protein